MNDIIKRNPCCKAPLIRCPICGTLTKEAEMKIEYEKGKRRIAELEADCKRLWNALDKALTMKSGRDCLGILDELAPKYGPKEEEK